MPRDSCRCDVPPWSRSCASSAWQGRSGDIPDLLAKGDVPEGCDGAGVRGGRRADGDVFRLALRLPTADSLCSLKVARASKISADGNFRRPLVGSLRALTSAEMAAPRGNTAARSG